MHTTEYKTDKHQAPLYSTENYNFFVVTHNGTESKKE